MTEEQTKILNCVKESKAPINKKEIIAKIGVVKNFDVVMRDLRVRNPEIQKIGQAAGTTYIWKEAKPVEVKNKEGYTDSTAAAAINNVMKVSTSYPERQKFGELWKVSGNNEYEGILVISAKEGTCIGCFVYDSRKGFMKDGYTFNWSDNTGRHWCSSLNIVNLRTNYIARKISEVPDQKKSEFRRLLAVTLGTEVTKEVEVKTVVETKTETVEVGLKDEEVQKLLDEQEKSYEKRLAERDERERAIKNAYEAKLLEQKIEIYERILFKKGA